MMIFKNHDELAFELASAIQAATDAKWGASNKSCSTYLRSNDKELRVSDHGDFHDWTGERKTIRFEHLIETVFYEMNFDTGDSIIIRERDYEGCDRSADYAGIQIEEADFHELVNEGVEYLSAN